MRFAHFAIIALLAAGAASAQQSVAVGPEIREADAGTSLRARWLAPAPGDFAPRALVADPSALPDSRHAEDAPVRFAWPLDDVSGTPAAARVTSRQYFVDATGAKLASGLALPLSARGAVIRVSALDDGADLRIAPDSVRLSVDGRAFDNASVMRMVADGPALNRQGMAAPPATLAFKLDPRVPAGQLELQVAGIGARQPVVVHVFEPESDWVAELSLPRHSYFGGETLAFEFGLSEGADRIAVKSVQAVLTDPFADRSWTLEVDGDAGRLVGPAPADRYVSGHRGLFEAHVYLEAAHAGRVIRRDLKLPVAVVPPLARLTGRTSARLDDGLDIAVGIETVAPGRFQVNGRIFGTAPDGTLRPLAMAQSAARIDGRFGTVTLAVDRDLVAGSGLSAPFEVRGLELLDQGRMFLLQRQARALRLTR
jgi:hypothetical protein